MRNTTQNETLQPLEVVQACFDAMGASSEAFLGVFETFFDEETIWDNVGVIRTVGRDEALRFAREFMVNYETMRVENLVLSAIGSRVFAERLDHFCTSDGSIVLTVPVLGVFEIKGTKIAQWRDYFNNPATAATSNRV